MSFLHLLKHLEDFLGGPVAQDSQFPKEEPIQSLVRELVPACFYAGAARHLQIN